MGNIQTKSKLLKLIRKEEQVCRSPEPRVGAAQIMKRVNRSEGEFVKHAAENHDVRIWRHGWPDFLLQDRSTGKTYAVEVKRGKDVVRESQAAMFVALEAAGIPVYVWNPAVPNRLRHWRSYAEWKPEPPREWYERWGKK
jgi:transposase InsO family protein